MTSGPLREVAILFTKLGIIGFGGPAAHIALMRDEVVRRRHWMDDQEFLAWVGATNLIPGPNSTELAIHLGHQRAGWKGLLTAGLCFIAPAVAIVATLAWLYADHGTDPRVVDLRYGVLPVIIAVIAQALVGLGRTALTNAFSAVLGLAAFGAYLVGVHELIVLAVAGALAAAWANRHRLRGPRATGLLAISPLAVDDDHARVARAVVLRLPGDRQRALRQWVRARRVLAKPSRRRSRLAHQPTTSRRRRRGPGHTRPGVHDGDLRRLADRRCGRRRARDRRDLPSVIHLRRPARKDRAVDPPPCNRAAFLAGVTVASLGLMGGVLVELADTAFTDPFTVLIGITALAVLLRTNINTAWLVAAGVGIGVIHAIAA